MDRFAVEYVNARVVQLGCSVCLGRLQRLILPYVSLSSIHSSSAACQEEFAIANGKPLYPECSLPDERLSEDMFGTWQFYPLQIFTVQSLDILCLQHNKLRAEADQSGSV
jgi:hypothetical protein